MASADKFIGKTFYAKKNRTKFRYPGDYKTTFPGQSKLYVFKPGELIGVVYSWLQKDGSLYWMFYDSNNKAYYVQHDDTAIELTKQIQNVIKVAESKEKAETEAAIQQNEQALIEAKGVIPYYIEKYAPWVLGAFILVSLGKSFIQRKA